MMAYQKAVRDRVEAWLADEDASVWDFVGVPNGGYSEEIDVDLANALQQMCDRKFWADNPYDELLAYLWCSVGVGEYGTSPRGAWLTGGLEDLVPKMVAKIRAHWGREL